MIYEILDENGNVINTITASLEFVEAAHPGRYREAENIDEPAPEPRYKPLTVFEYKGLVRFVSQMTPSQNRAWAEDPSDEAYLVREQMSDYGTALIDINTDRGMAAIAGGLDIMAALGHVGSLTAVTLKPAVLAAWPKE